MKPYTTAIDTVKIQLDFTSQKQQHTINNELIEYMSNYYFVKHKDYMNETGQIKRVFYIYYNNTYICSISTGIYTTLNRHKIPTYVYYISIKLAGLKRYNEAIDKASNDCLFRICAFLNVYRLTFKLTQLDIAIDINADFDNVLTVCTKRTPNTQYFGLAEQQKFQQTRYIENINYDRLYKVSKHAYTYDKAYKEGLNYTLTRFELSLRPKFFSKHGTDTEAIAATLDRYHVMYFPTIEEKEKKISEYDSYKNFRSRDVKRIGFESYRLYPDLIYISIFLYWMYHIDFSHLEENLS